jgi:hypothetical protein
VTATSTSPINYDSPKPAHKNKFSTGSTGSTSSDSSSNGSRSSGGIHHGIDDAEFVTNNNNHTNNDGYGHQYDQNDVEMT